MGTAARPLEQPRTLTVLTWHIHGSYLNYLAYCGHDLVVPVLPGRPVRFAGRPSDATWPANVREIPAEEIRNGRFDVILYQHRLNWTEDRHRWLTDAQLASTPQAYIEHDPPRKDPTEERHPVDDGDCVIVHVTHFNDLMWDSGRNPVRVIEHGVTVPDDAVWSGERDCGLAIVNNIGTRGRRLGLDVLRRMQQRVPVELVGINSDRAGGRGEIVPHLLPYEIARHRFVFNPIRYTSLGLAVCEALMVGAPVVGLATTEMVVAVENGVTGFVHTDVERLADFAEELVRDYPLASRLSAAARDRARERYGIDRFEREWDVLLRELAGARRRITATASESATPLSAV
jgi:hypothetical protein